MKNYLAAICLILFVLSACMPTQDEPVGSTEPAATGTPAVTSQPTDAPAETAVPATDTDDDLEAFIEELKTAVTNQDTAAMQAFMNDPFAIGAWLSEWSTLNTQQAISQLQNNGIHAPLSVQFTHLSLDEITEMLQQPPDTMLAPDTKFVAALHSTGWGQNGGEEAILFITEEDGRYVWSAFLYTNGRFADMYMPITNAPIGTIYTIWNEGVYQIQADGQHQQLLNAEAASIPNLRVSPDGHHAAYLTLDNNDLWLIDIASGKQQQLAPDYNLSGFLMWADKNNLFTGVWLDPSEAEGPNNGHITTINIESGEVTILDETSLSSGRPAMLADYNRSAFDVFAAGQGDILTGRLYHPDSGLQTFDQTTFTAQNEMITSPLFNPAWSPIGNKMSWLASTGERVGVQVYDLETQTAMQIFDWDPARFGALVPSPTWSPDGQWLALEVWANGVEGSGMWLIAADGSNTTLIDSQGKEPYWANNNQFVFGVNEGTRLYDLPSQQTFKLDLPPGSWILGVTSLADLVALPEVAHEIEVTPESGSSPVNVEDLPIAAQQTVVSPDGSWQATVTQSEPTIVDSEEKFYATLSATDGQTTWTPIAEWRGYGLGLAYPVIQQWSANGRYLYYSNKIAVDGCAIFNNGMDLYRLDVTDGSVDTLLDTGLTWNLALSPDETQIAYTEFNGQEVVAVLHDTDSAKEQRVVVMDSVAAQAGNI
ncbi:MAG: PD40 domain-containing protein, partial [Anaerolineae bacterium]|nr:PD40 domain-containing protein [Anaerolineae bacterium]